MSQFLGIELGSTRIKAILTDNTGKPVASGDYAWENKLAGGIWTYDLADAWHGLRKSLSCLFADYALKNADSIPEVSGIGISAMMHGYLVFDKHDKQLTGFRTWRNTITENSADLLTKTFNFNIPQRWSIAHLHHAMSGGETHVGEIDCLTTLGGYIHYKLTGNKVVGIGEASGIFPIDSSINDYHEKMLEQFNEIASEFKVPWKLRDILPKVLVAGEDAGHLTEEGAGLLDPTGIIKPGIPLCPPEGDAGTGMVATNAITPNTGNISAGTSVFAMLVLSESLSKPHPQIDIIATPTGKPVAMVHSNNCTADLDAWVNLIHDIIKLVNRDETQDKGELYRTLYNAALGGDTDCGGVISINYLSGEHMTGFSQGRPLLVRKPESVLTAGNFMRSLLLSAMTTLRIGMDILAEEEGISVSKLLGHGGLFKTPGVAQRLMAGALNTPVAVMDSAGEGGAWGISLLAAYRAEKEQGQSLEEFLESKIFVGSAVSVIEPDVSDAQGFDKYLEQYKNALEIERKAVEVL